MVRVKKYAGTCIPTDPFTIIEPQNAQRGVRRRAQGDLLQVQEEPQKGPEAGRKEVVLHPHPGVRPLLKRPRRPLHSSRPGLPDGMFGNFRA